MKFYWLITVCGLVIGCSDPPKSPELRGANEIGSSSPICESLRSDIRLRPFEELISGLCNTEALSTITSESRLYRGHGQPMLLTTPENIGDNKTSMVIQGAFSTSTDPAVYHSMLRLAKFNPTEFEARKLYEVPADVKYEVLKSDDQYVTFNYTNLSQSPEIVVRYKSISGFYSLKDGDLYVMANKLTESYETVEDMIAMVIVYRVSNGVTNVINLAKQTYDNNNDHQATATKAEEAFSKEIQRSYRNSLQASRDQNLVNGQP